MASTVSLIHGSSAKLLASTLLRSKSTTFDDRDSRLQQKTNKSYQSRKNKAVCFPVCRSNSGPTSQVTQGEPDLISSKTPNENSAAAESSVSEFREAPKRRRQAESTDWIASAVTRRFGLGAGLAWVGFLAFGVISEQVKTRFEVFVEQRDTKDVTDVEEVVLPDGIRYKDFRVGGGSSPRLGDLVLISLVGRVLETGKPFVDTTAPGNRDLVFAFGVRPYVGWICDGLVEAISSMKVGGKREAIIPSEFGFGKSGVKLEDDFVVPANATLVFDIELKRVSIPPS